MQYQIPSPHPPIGGALVQKTDRIPAVAAIEMSRYNALQQNRFLIAANVYRHQGATVQRTDPIPPTARIEMGAYIALKDATRPFTKAILPLQGATLQSTDPIASFGQPIFALYPGRQQLVEMPDLSQAIAQPQSDICPLPLPNLSLWPGRQQLPEVQQFDGPSIQGTVPIPGVAQIEMTRYRALEAVRTIPGAAVSLHQGATIQRTDPILPFGQPLYSLYPQRQFLQPITQLTLVVPSDVLILPQANLSLFPGRQYPIVSPQLPQALAPQTYIFPMPLPELSRFKVYPAFYNPWASVWIDGPFFPFVPPPPPGFFRPDSTFGTAGVFRLSSNTGTPGVFREDANTGHAPEIFKPKP